MSYMLDTNICIYLIKQKPPQVLKRFQKHNVGEIALSSITVAELQYGVSKNRSSQKNHLALQQFLSPLLLLDFDHRAAQTYGQIRAALERQGMLIGPLDTLIAAHALSLGLTLVTNNTKEFERVQGLNVENWV